MAAQASITGKVFSDLRVALFAVGDRPVLAKAAAKLVGVTVTAAILSEASAALADELEPQEDQEASAAMRRHLAQVLLARCVSALLDRQDFSGGRA
jgi:carbon-monoxide dehydrogenase medium subunit